jgi:hypothetical protein
MRRRSPCQAQAHVGRVEVGATFDGQWRMASGGTALGSASAGVMRTKESGWAGIGPVWTME